MVRQYQKLLKMENVDLEFTPEALRELAREAQRRNTGARGLRALLENLMLDVMYEAPRRKKAGRYVITEKVVRGHINVLDVEEKTKPSAPPSKKLDAAG